MANTQGLRKRLDEMEKGGIVRIIVNRDYHLTVNVSLTELGKEISSILLKMNKIIDNGKSIKEKSIDMKYTDPICRILLENGTMVQKDIIDNVGSFRVVVKVLELMVDEGLLVRDCVGREVHYTLTSDGEKIAKGYRKINALLTE